MRNFLGLVDRRTVLIAILAMVFTKFCLERGWQAEVPTDLLGIAVVFPIVFSISAAWRRREEALALLASMKADSMALFIAHRDWVPDGSPEHAWRARRLVREVLQAVLDYLSGSPDQREEALTRFYRGISGLSRSNEDLRRAGVPPNEISRASQYVRYLMVDFEKLRNIRRYRTPRSMRAYSGVFLNSFPVLFAPAFAWLASRHYEEVGLAVAALYAVVLGALDNVEQQLEDPFDNVGVDDVRLDILAEADRTMALEDPLERPQEEINAIRMPSSDSPAMMPAETGTT